MEQTPTNVRDMLLRDEGRVPYAYRDHLGYLTIGCGRLIDKAKGGRLSDAEIDFLLDNDIGRVTAEIADVLPWTALLDPVRRAVLIGMAFQLGTSGLTEFTHTLDSVRNGRYFDASGLMLQSLWAQQTPERAQRMAKQMETGQWQ